MQNSALVCADNAEEKLNLNLTIILYCSWDDATTNSLKALHNFGKNLDTDCAFFVAMGYTLFGAPRSQEHQAYWLQENKYAYSLRHALHSHSCV